MTREISEYAERSGDFTYHITSLRPLNPGNAADDFEKIALLEFENGEIEKRLLFIDKEKSTYRYMAPLYVEEGCMGCHAKQGYQVGDVRGGISVTFDVTDIRKQMIGNRFVFIGMGVAVTLVVLSIIYALLLSVYRKLSNAYNTIEIMSVTDELTQVYNRRHFHVRLDEEIQRATRYRHPLSLILIDIDHFKSVNDIFGHQVGDEVLSGVAHMIKTNTRQVDVMARYGGEEFILILPETDEHKALRIADKLRKLVKKHDFSPIGSEEVNVTVSLGISSLSMIEEGIADKAGEMVKMADDALYNAKESGRDTAVLAPGRTSEKTGLAHSRRRWESKS
jgi:diguanylate cyclase (GGDEF)-like protein